MKLYSDNFTVAKQVINHIATKGITEFKTQNELYCLIEDFKSPELISVRERRSSYTSPNVPVYSQNNYTSIVEWMINNGLIERTRGYRKNVISYIVTSLLPIYANAKRISDTY
jgi:hypothetical protein